MLSPADVVAVHEAALRVLERTGVLIQDDEAVALLRSRGARGDGRRVFLAEGAVRAALAAAPSSFTLHGRSPARDVRFGGGRAVFGSCSGPAFVLDGARVRPGTLADLEATIKLGHVSSVIEFHGDSVELLDLPEEERTPRAARMPGSCTATRLVSGWRRPMPTSTWPWRPTRSSSAPSGTSGRAG